MIIYKYPHLEEEYHDIRFCSVLKQKTDLIARLLFFKYQIHLTITSIYRRDSIPHSEWRALDFRTIDPISNIIIIDDYVFSKIENYHRIKLQKYGRYDSMIKHEVKNEDGTSRGEHVHIQTPRLSIKLNREE